MAPKHFIELLILSSVWGASFLFMRVAAPEFGAINLAALRIIIAAITLAPLLYFTVRKYRKSQALSPIFKPLVMVSVGNSVLPFMLFGYAALNIDAGLSSIINGVTPLWGALFSMVILSVTLTRAAWFGLLIGFIGVVVLSSHKLAGGFNSEVLSILAVTCATCLYGISANYSKRFLVGVPPLMVASGTMATGAVIMSPLVLSSEINWQLISTNAWFAIIALGVISTGFAYVLFYRLIENTGPTKAMMVTYLIPIFGVLFGNVFLNEQLFINMLFGGLLILFGVMLTTGLIKPGKTSN